MFEFFASMFGYLLQLLYNVVNNYGIAIILFTIIIKLILLPFSIKQQKTMQKSAKLQEKMKVLQFKYKNDPEKLNQEVMSLYKEEKMSPFSGCLTSIIQFLLILSIFYLVKSPLTYMVKISTEDINHYISQLQEEGKSISKTYPEIDIMREYEWLKEKNEGTSIDRVNLNMNFLGLDLSKVPQQNLQDYTVYIIPVLYIISSFVSMKITTNMQKETLQKQNVIDGETGKELTVQEGKDEIDTVMQTNKMMSWMIPIMSVSIAVVAPLGLALYWLVNNILMIAERLMLNKFLKTEEEA